MSFIRADRVKETTITTGTSAYALGGAATGFDTFSAVMANGEACHYAVEDGVGGYEVGVGTWNTGNTLTRTQVVKSSNANAAVSWSAGTKTIFMTLAAYEVGTHPSEPAKTASYKFLRDDAGRVWEINGSVTLTFDTSAKLTAQWSTKIKNVGTAAVTVDPGASRKIGGSTTATTGTLRPGDLWEVRCDGTDLPIDRLAGRTVIVHTGSTSFIPEPGVKRERIRAAGGGASGSAGGTAGNAGGSTIIAGVTCGGGSPDTLSPITGGPGPDGGAVSGAVDVRVDGGSGGRPNQQPSDRYLSGRGGDTPLGNGGASVSGIQGGITAAIGKAGTGYGAGGGGSVDTANAGGGGSGGAYAEFTIDVTPGSAVSFSIGAGGASVTGGGGTASGAGAQGIIIREFT